MEYPTDKMMTTEEIKPIKRITGQICMGSGNFSLAEMGYLYSRLSDAFDILSGIQQSPMATDAKEVWEKYKKETSDGEYDIEKIAKEIYLALTGEKVIKTEKVK
jgi:hypothetical protein